MCKLYNECCTYPDSIWLLAIFGLFTTGQSVDCSHFILYLFSFFVGYLYFVFGFDISLFRWQNGKTPEQEVAAVAELLILRFSECV